jgi:hypothetical protein
MQNIGYNTNNSLILLGSIAIYLTLYWLKVFAYFFLKLFVITTGKGIEL